jgi:hypothetical protein
VAFIFSCIFLVVFIFFPLGRIPLIILFGGHEFL